MNKPRIPARERFHWYEGALERAKLTGRIASAMVGGAIYGALGAGIDILEDYQAAQAEKQADFDRIEAYVNSDHSHKLE